MSAYDVLLAIRIYLLRYASLVLESGPLGRVIALAVPLAVVLLLVFGVVSCVSGGPQQTDEDGEQQTAVSQEADSATASAPVPSSSVFSLGSDGILTVALDPGHGAEDSGAIGVTTGVQEKDITWQIARYAAAELGKYGVRVIMTRGEDENPTLEERAQRAYDGGADLLLSIHINDNDEAGYVQGFVVYYPNEISTWKWAETVQPGMELAAAIEANLAKLGLKDNGIMQEPMQIDPSNSEQTKYVYPNDTTGVSDYYAMVRWPRKLGIPAVLIESGFLSNVDDEAFLSDKVRLQAIGKAEADAVLTCYGYDLTK